MKKQKLTIYELKEFGFQEKQGDTLEDGGFYRWWVLYKNDCELHITHQYHKNKKFETGYVEFNGETLKGRELTANDVKFLIELM